jgi:hypothetical protein
LGIFGLRIYELLKQYETIKNRTLSIDEMKRMFEIEEEYPLFANFFQKVITPSVDDINQYTDITITKLEKIKEGKKVVSLRFFFESKPQEQINNMRNDTFQESMQLPLLNDFEELEQDNTVSLFDKYYPIVGSFWGINESEFKKRLIGKSEKDVEEALDYTKEIIRNGTAKNPAGLFLDALTNGHKSKENIKKSMAEAKKKQQAELADKIKPLLDTLEDLENDYAKALNDGIRNITDKDPSVTIKIIEKLKEKYRLLGDKIVGKTIDDFRKDEMLRGLVKQEIMSTYPDKFVTIHAQYEAKIEAVKKAILVIDSGFKF